MESLSILDLVASVHIDRVRVVRACIEHGIESNRRFHDPLDASTESELVIWQVFTSVDKMLFESASEISPQSLSRVIHWAVRHLEDILSKSRIDVPKDLPLTEFLDSYKGGFQENITHMQDMFSCSYSWALRLQLHALSEAVRIDVNDGEGYPPQNHQYKMRRPVPLMDFLAQYLQFRPDQLGLLHEFVDEFLLLRAKLFMGVASKVNEELLSSNTMSLQNIFPLELIEAVSRTLFELVRLWSKIPDGSQTSIAIESPSFFSLAAAIEVWLERSANAVRDFIGSSSTFLSRIDLAHELHEFDAEFVLHRTLQKPIGILFKFLVEGASATASIWTKEICALQYPNFDAASMPATWGVCRSQLQFLQAHLKLCSRNLPWRTLKKVIDHSLLTFAVLFPALPPSRFPLDMDIVLKSRLETFLLRRESYTRSNNKSNKLRQALLSDSRMAHILHTRMRPSKEPNDHKRASDVRYTSFVDHVLNSDGRRTASTTDISSGLTRPLTQTTSQDIPSISRPSLLAHVAMSFRNKASRLHLQNKDLRDKLNVETTLRQVAQRKADMALHSMIAADQKEQDEEFARPWARTSNTPAGNEMRSNEKPFEDVLDSPTQEERVPSPYNWSSRVSPVAESESLLQLSLTDVQKSKRESSPSTVANIAETKQSTHERKALSTEPSISGKRSCTTHDEPLEATKKSLATHEIRRGNGHTKHSERQTPKTVMVKRHSFRDSHSRSRARSPPAISRNKEILSLVSVPELSSGDEHSSDDNQLRKSEEENQVKELVIPERDVVSREMQLLLEESSRRPESPSTTARIAYHDNEHETSQALRLIETLLGTVSIREDEHNDNADANKQNDARSALTLKNQQSFNWVASQDEIRARTLQSGKHVQKYDHRRGVSVSSKHDQDADSSDDPQAKASNQPQSPRMPHHTKYQHHRPRYQKPFVQVRHTRHRKRQISIVELPWDPEDLEM